MLPFFLGNGSTSDQHLSYSSYCIFEAEAIVFSYDGKEQKHGKVATS